MHCSDSERSRHFWRLYVFVVENRYDPWPLKTHNNLLSIIRIGLRIGDTTIRLNFETTLSKASLDFFWMVRLHVLDLTVMVNLKQLETTDGTRN